ncbi:CBS domain-containing protein [Neobacillus cucumis]|uniref:CBS domain-containing protein n=1 Tax=Neobacillus cucumis TaxID=1740721 RepID=UPI00203EF0A7|nr:CBS domain-containing protein [Neobacillus cucumis]MCM3729654.1 CBS domain-containing protein [Neobacillus cucumis]
MNVASVMTTDIDCCTPESTCKEVAIKMKELDVGVIPVCENEKLVGIITDRDLVIKGLANDLSEESPVSKLITDMVVKGTKDMSIEEAAKIMSHEQIRRLPIVENEKLVGMVSLGDLAVNNQSSEKAGEALKDISVPSEPNK